MNDFSSRKPVAAGLRWSALLGLLLLAAGSPAARAADPPAAVAAAPPITLMPVEQVCAAAARASGAPSHRGTWRLTGSARLRGADESFEMILDAEFRFRMSVTGVLPQADAFDGKDEWTNGPSGIPHKLILHDRDTDRMVAWMISGAWAEEAAPLVREAAPAAPGKVGLRIRPVDGVVWGSVLLDATTYLPDSFRSWSDSGDEVWGFRDYRRFDGRLLPTTLIDRVGQQVDEFHLTAAAPAQRDSSQYRMPDPDPTRAMFDGIPGGVLELKRAFGQLFVHPRVDGQDVGWFFLDTGADGMCVDSGVARRLKLSDVGSDTVAGVVGVSQMQICQAQTLQLGPVTLEKPVFLELELAQMDRVFGFPIAGICGYDYLAAASLDIDPQAGTLRVFPPGAAPLPPTAVWTPIQFDSNTPCIECAFAGPNRGFFTLDTGSTSTVDFYSPAVEALHLLEHQNGSKVTTSGIGGTAESREGKIDWFELGGKRIQQPVVGFQLTKVGAFASPHHTGNVGMGLLGSFRLVLDYRNERMAFLEPLPGK